MLVLKNSQFTHQKRCSERCQELLSLFVASVVMLSTSVRERRRKAQSLRDMQRLDAHLLADIGFRRQDGNALVALATDRANAGVALVNSQRRQTRLKAAFLVRRRQLLRSGRSGP
jgi:uncharacterized protein YjiS (DUF1127 family)